MPPARDVAFPRYAWRSDRQFSVPRNTLAARTRVVDGYFRWSDPLPAIYYYGYERLAMRVWRRTIRLTRETFAHTVRAH